jgi:5-oxopent-3-ene-1,2,5-tricarboxylate decarboxylase/2-hydroxyhepta-2,4-diene-1,7-dioate isomerase
MAMSETVFPFARRGTVYGTLLNHPASLRALGAAVNAPPYKSPPTAPVLYIKPRNTWVGDGQPVVVPRGVQALEIGPSLGLVIGRSSCRLTPGDALLAVAGFVIVNDVGIAHASYYRPSLRFKVRDTFCPIGAVVDRHAAGPPDERTITVRIDGEVVHRCSTAGLVRPAAQLLADVSEFMTLAPGDILMLGVAPGTPSVRPGQRVAIEIDGVGCLENPFVAEEQAP